MLGADLSIFKKGVILIVLPVVFQLGMLGYLLKVQRDVAEAEGREVHTKNVIEHVNQIVLGLTEAHSAIRAMGFFHDATFEPDKRAVLRSLPKQLSDLKELVSDNPRQLANLKPLTAAMDEYIRWFDDVEQHAGAGQWDEFDTHLKALYGKERVDEVHAQLRHFLGAEEQLGAQRLAAAAESRQKQRSAFTAVGVMTVLLAVGLVGVFTRSISARLAVATQNAQRMAEGEPLAQPVHGSDEIARLDAVLHDTARRLAEATAAEKHYAEELRGRGEELERINTDLMYKTQENETFVYSVSHDLRSPLVNLQGFTKELTLSCDDLRKALREAPLPAGVQTRIDSIIDQDVIASIGFIQTAVSRASNIINALLRLSRAGRVEYEWQNVDMNPVIEQIVAAMRVSLDEKKAEVQVAPLPAVRADPTAVEQIFANLIGNAVNYLSPQRPGRIEVGMAEPQGGNNGQTVTLYVRDNGLGVPSAYLSKLFVAFQRLHGEVAKGEGVGLALVKRIVDRHGGRVWAQSTEGVGTVFYVSLRKADGPARPTPARSTAPAAPKEEEGIA